MLSLKNVTIANKKTNINLLNNVSLEVKQGDFIVVGGQNDIERETLISTIGALEELSSGEMYVDGIELTKYTQAQKVLLRREKFGYMLLDTMLDENLSVRDNISLPLVFAGVIKEKCNELVERALSIIGLTNFTNVLVKKITSWQKNKVMIARAIVANPSVVIFSEPCRVLDKFKMDEVLGLLKALNGDGVTVIVNSNQAEYSAIAKRRIIINNGSIVELKKERAPKQTETKPRQKRTVKKERTPKKKQIDTLNEQVQEVQPKVADQLIEVKTEPVLDEVKQEVVKARTKKEKTKTPKTSRTTKTTPKENKEKDEKDEKSTGEQLKLELGDDTLGVKPAVKRTRKRKEILNNDTIN